ncbi:MAG TPA: LytR family transcriptional regulator, partial [Candidatus Moranbacteria bacterium]|nr:LytR family transcriptional regulator [Candidatus Moranbacteria bacterium]
VPAGTSVLDGERALCYVRARKTSSDFDRARRQQEIMKALYEKAFSLGTLTDFGKIDALLDAVGNNLSTDMQLWEMQRFFELYQEKGFPKIAEQRVLDNSPEGLLYKPEGAGENGRAYILRPRGDNYDRIRDLFANLFSGGEKASPGDEKPAPNQN